MCFTRQHHHLAGGISRGQKIINIKFMARRYAVIDLGTNTFHLLVAERQENNGFNELYSQRFFVKLAESGIETISKAAIQRGLEALQSFREVLDQLKVDKVKAIGTAALRTATNGPQFIQTVRQQFNIPIEVIDGNREADLIYKGVLQAVPFRKENYLLMDIGGGSVEFIIANKNQVWWAQSFPIGLAVLYKNFHHSEPISSLEKNILNTFLTQQLNPLFDAIRQFPVSILVGASGTFDVLENILAKSQEQLHHAVINVSDFYPLCQLLCAATRKERLEMKDIPDTRVDMIVVALLLIRFILEQTKVRQIFVSNYAMKEGMMTELIV